MASQGCLIYGVLSSIILLKMPELTEVKKNLKLLQVKSDPQWSFGLL